MAAEQSYRAWSLKKLPTDFWGVLGGNAATWHGLVREALNLSEAFGERGVERC